MEKAKDIFKIGQVVKIIVKNSHNGDFGVIVGFDAYNEYNLKIKFEDGTIQGYMVEEIISIPRMAQRIPFDANYLKKITRKLLKYKI